MEKVSKELATEFQLLDVSGFMQSLPRQNGKVLVNFADTVKTEEVRWAEHSLLMMQKAETSRVLNTGRSFNVPTGFALVFFGVGIQPTIVSSHDTAPLILYVNAHCSSVIKGVLVKLLQPISRLELRDGKIKYLHNAVTIDDHMILGNKILATDRDHTIWISKPYSARNAYSGTFTVASILYIIKNYSFVEVSELEPGATPGINYNWRMVFGDDYESCISKYLRYLELIRYQKRIDELTNDANVKRLLNRYGAVVSLDELLKFIITTPNVSETDIKAKFPQAGASNSISTLTYQLSKILKAWSFG